MNNKIFLILDTTSIPSDFRYEDKQKSTTSEGPRFRPSRIWWNRIGTIG